MFYTILTKPAIKNPKFSDIHTFVVMTLEVQQYIYASKQFSGNCKGADPEQSEPRLSCLPRPICRKTMEFYGT